jgi:hypothetical protein
MTIPCHHLSYVFHRLDRHLRHYRYRREEMMMHLSIVEVRISFPPPRSQMFGLSALRRSCDVVVVGGEVKMDPLA